MSRIKIGQIGVCHEHAAAKMQTLRRLPDVFEIAGVVDDRGSSAPRFAGDDLSAYEGLTWLTLEALLDTPGLQAVVIETANGDLVPTALRCMERGVPMHLDKPGSEDHASFLKLINGCKDRDLFLQMGYMFRHNPAMQWCRQAITHGWLGEVLVIEANMSHDYGGDAYQRYLAKFEGGIMYNLGCHLIDLVVAMMGKPSAVTPFLKAAPGDGEDARNLALAVLAYPHALATLRVCSREVKGLNQRRLKVCGTRGTFELCPLERFDGQPLQATLTLSHAADKWPAGVHTLDFGITTDRYAGQLLELAGVIQGKQPNPRTYDHDALVHEVLLRACSAEGSHVNGEA